MSAGVEVEDVAIPLALDPPRRVLVRIYRAAVGTLPVVLYLPSAAAEASPSAEASADGLARRLVAALPVAVMLPEAPLDRGGEPAPGQRGWLAGRLAAWLAQHGERRGLDGSRVLTCGTELELAFDAGVDALGAALVQGSGESSGNLGVGG